MSEKNEAPKILIATKGMSVDQMRSALPIGVGERRTSQRNFLSIQHDLVELIDKPNEQKENELKLERARLLNDAKEAGVFRPIKQTVLELQELYEPEVAFKKINLINTNSLENEAQALSGWKKEFEGMLEEYKLGALRNMQLVAIEIGGQTETEEYLSLKTASDLLGWGTPPAGLERIMREAINPKSSVNPPMDPGEFARAMAEAQGIMTPRQYLEAYRTAENFYVPFKIDPGSEPRFWPILTEKQKDQWLVRSILITAYYKKSIATGTDKLYMDEMRELAVDLNKRSLRILFGKNGMDGALPVAGIYSTIIGDKNFYRYEDLKSYEGLDEKTRKKNQQKYNLKNILCKVLENKKTHSDLVSDYGVENVHQLETLEKTLRGACPESIYQCNQDSHRSLREAVSYWLLTKGRNLLLTEDERRNRNNFFKDKNKAYEILKERAEDAEHVGWEFTFITSQLEHFDSRAYRPSGTKRFSPSNFWTLFQWMAMHPQERFEQKIVRSTDNGPQAKEEWAALGTWALYNASSGNWSVNQNGKTRVVFPKILPDVVIRDALHPSRFQDGRGEDGSLFTSFNSIGNKVLFQTNTTTRREIEEVIEWDKMNDAPFVPYNYDEMRWADVVLQVFKKGKESKVSLVDLGEAVRNLRLTEEQRMNLLVAYFGAHQKSYTLKPIDNFIDWKLRVKSVKELFPNFFLNR